MAALWRPCKGVLIKEVDINLYVFQFYHEIDIKRVIEGSSWSFNRKALIIARMKEGDIPRAMNLHTMDLWVQIHELRPGFMTEKVIQEVGNYIGTFVHSCPSNFTGGWKEYLRARITVDLSKPLKRRMKVRKTGNEWFWIVFKYENIPTFCFICGIIGHSDKFCSRLFDTPENEIIKPYGSWMRAPLRRQTKMIGAKWLRDGSTDDRNPVADAAWTRTEVMNQDPRNQEKDLNDGENLVRATNTGANEGILNGMDTRKDKSQHNPEKKGVTIIESKKRKTGVGPDQINEVMNSTELDLGSEEESDTRMDQDTQIDSTIPKNVKLAGLAQEVRQGL